MLAVAAHRACLGGVPLCGWMCHARLWLGVCGGRCVGLRRGRSIKQSHDHTITRSHDHAIKPSSHQVITSSTAALVAHLSWILASPWSIERATCNRMATAWQPHGNRMAIAWQSYSNRMAIAW
jgi:hypothetical protein